MLPEIPLLTFVYLFRIPSGEGRSTPDGIIYEQALGEMKRIEEGNKKILEDETTKSSADVLNKRPGGATVFSQPEAKRSKVDDSSEYTLLKSLTTHSYSGEDVPAILSYPFLCVDLRCFMQLQLIIVNLFLF